MYKYNVGVAVLVVALFSGCSIQKPTFQQSNQYVLEQTMSALNIGKVLKKKVSPNSKFILRSIERKVTLDEPIIAMIEDQAVTSLYNEGFKVLERDAHTIEHLVHESGKTFEVEKKFKPLIDTLKVDELALKKSNGLVAPAHTYIQSKLQSADYIISYRILEVGIRYNSLDDGFQWSDLSKARWWFPWAYPNEIERETMARLMIRVEDTHSSRIIYTNILESRKKDILEKGLADKLKDYHYNFYAPTGENKKNSGGLFSSLFH